MRKWNNTEKTFIWTIVFKTIGHSYPTIFLMNQVAPCVV